MEKLGKPLINKRVRGGDVQMTIRSIDFQVAVPKTQEVAKIKQNERQMPISQQHNLATEGQKEQEEKRTKVSKNEELTQKKVKEKDEKDYNGKNKQSKGKKKRKKSDDNADDSSQSNSQERLGLNLDIKV